jgi:hypothetical protein
MLACLLADNVGMEHEWWAADGVGPSRDDDRFLFLLSIGVGFVAALGVILYLVLR